MKIIDAIRRLFGRRLGSFIMHDLQTGESLPVMQTNSGQLYRKIAIEEVCPDCGGKGFYIGRRGGTSINVHCMNRDCRSNFNVTDFGNGEGICQRVGKRDLSWYPRPAIK